jgi:putative RecB family exonuclease
VEKKVAAIWAAIERACEHDDFRPKQSALCKWCAFSAYCPAFGGDPDEARAIGVALAAERAAERAAADAPVDAVPVDAVRVDLTAPGSRTTA